MLGCTVLRARVKPPGLATSLPPASTALSRLGDGVSPWALIYSCSALVHDAQWPWWYILYSLRFSSTYSIGISYRESPFNALSPLTLISRPMAR